MSVTLKNGQVVKTKVERMIEGTSPQVSYALLVMHGVDLHNPLSNKKIFYKGLGAWRPRHLVINWINQQVRGGNLHHDNENLLWAGNICAKWSGNQYVAVDKYPRWNNLKSYVKNRIVYKLKIMLNQIMFKWRCITKPDMEWHGQ